MLFFVIMTRIPGMPFKLYRDGQVVALTWNNIIKGIFFHEFYFPFWFMQNLIVLTALSPVLVILLRKRYTAYITIIILMILAMLDINTLLCQTSSALSFILGGTLSVYHREYWEKQNSNHFETAMYIVLFLICAVFKWLSIPFIPTIYSVVTPILFWKSCELLGKFHRRRFEQHYVQNKQ